MFLYFQRLLKIKTCNFPLNVNNLHSAEGNVAFSLHLMQVICWCVNIRSLEGIRNARYAPEWLMTTQGALFELKYSRDQGKRNTPNYRTLWWFRSCRRSRAHVMPAEAGVSLIAKSSLQLSLLTKASQCQDLLSANLPHLAKNHIPFWRICSTWNSEVMLI